MNGFERWIASWLDMICGFLGVVTFNWFRPWWDFDYRGRTTLRAAKKALNKPRDSHH